MSIIYLCVFFESVIDLQYQQWLEEKGDFFKSLFTKRRAIPRCGRRGDIQPLESTGNVCIMPPEKGLRGYGLVSLFFRGYNNK